MGLSEEERKSIVTYRMEKTKDTMLETKNIISANAWYYADQLC
jgi:hypothetical protein